MVLYAASSASDVTPGESGRPQVARNTGVAFAARTFATNAWAPAANRPGSTTGYWLWSCMTTMSHVLELRALASAASTECCWSVLPPGETRDACVRGASDVSIASRPPL
jgi:hypothetical protein